MTFNPRYSFEIDDNGLAITNGSTVFSGVNDPSTITVTVPCYYLRTNGEIWYNTGSGPWVLLISGGGIMPNNIPEYISDPVSPIAGTTWVLHDGVVGSPLGLLLSLTNNQNSYKLSYQTLSGSVVRTPLT